MSNQKEFKLRRDLVKNLKFRALNVYVTTEYAYFVLKNGMVFQVERRLIDVPPELTTGWLDDHAGTPKNPDFPLNLSILTPGTRVPGRNLKCVSLRTIEEVMDKDVNNKPAITGTLVFRDNTVKLIRKGRLPKFIYRSDDSTGEGSGEPMYISAIQIVALHKLFPESAFVFVHRTKDDDYIFFEDNRLRVKGMIPKRKPI